MVRRLALQQIFFVLFLALLGFSPLTFAANYYVASSNSPQPGNDNNPGTEAQPFGTIEKARDTAQPGDTIFLRQGQHAKRAGSPDSGIFFRAGGTAGAPITIKNYPNERPIVSADANQFVFYFFESAPYWVVEGLELRGGSQYAVKIDSPRVTLRGNNIHGSSLDLVKLVQTSDYVTIEGNEIHSNNASPGANAQGVDAVGSDYLVVRDNYVHNIPSVGIYSKGDSIDTVFEYNRVEDIAGHGIMLGQQTDRALFTRGTFYETTNGVIRNNIVKRTTGACFATGGSLSPKIYNNSCYLGASTNNGAVYVTMDNPETNQRGRDIHIKNNIVYGAGPGVNGDRPVLYVSPSAVDSDNSLYTDNNVYWELNGAGAVRFTWTDRGLDSVDFTAWRNATGLDANSTVADPSYASAPADLKPGAGSPAIDRGANGAFCAATDYDKTSRPRDGDGNGTAICDIGAYEVGAAAPPPPPPPSGNCTTATAGTAQWQNTPFAPQTGTFTAQWEATPAQANMDGITALSLGPQTTWSGLAAIVRFNTSNAIDARNGGTYTAVNNIPYVPNATYRVRMDINVPARTFSAWVTPPGGSEQIVAQNYAFRTEQQSVTSLDNFNVEAEIGSITACNFTLNPTADTPVPGTTTRWENNDSRLTYSPVGTGAWSLNGSSTYASGGNYAVGNGAGAVLSFSFTGTGVAWVAFMDQYSGQARVTLDGVSEVVDLYRPAGHAEFGWQKIAWQKTGLAAGTHNVKIEVLGTQNASSGGIGVSVDAFDITQ